MIPVLFSWGSIHLYSYGLSLAVGLLIALHLMRRRAAKGDFLKPDDVSDILMAVFIWGFAGARLLFVIQNLSLFVSNPLKVFAVWEGGLVFYGGAIAGTFGFYITAKLKKLSFWKLLDFFTPYAALVQCFGRIGCFLNGCCYGKTCDLPWAVHFPHVEGLVHPTQIYEAIYDLALFFFLLARRRSARFEGEVGLLYFLLYAFGRYLIEFAREPGLSWMGLTFNQWISAGIIFVAFIFFKVRLSMTERKHGKPTF